MSQSESQVSVKKVSTAASPNFSAFYEHNPVLIICDSGATSSLIRHNFALKLQMPISPTSHSASQADGKTHMKACGEVHVRLARGALSSQLQAVVVSDLDCDILAGVPFMRDNNILLDIPHDRIIIQGKHLVSYSPQHRSTRISRFYIPAVVNDQIIM